MLGSVGAVGRTAPSAHCMATKQSDSTTATRGLRALGVVVLVQAGILAVLFFRAFLPDFVVFSNDGPLGIISSAAYSAPEFFRGVWLDLNWVGYAGTAIAPSISGVLLWVLGPLSYSKFLAPISLLILGLGAWTFLRALKLSPTACLLGGVAAVLNSTFFSAACWGVAPHVLTIAMNYFALALLTDLCGWRGPARLILAGMCVGTGIMEGADLGALFSLFVAAYVLFRAWQTTAGPVWARLARGAGQVAVVAVAAAFIAAHSLTALITTQIKGVAGTEQDSRTKEERWDWATQWSLPKTEALGFLVPGLFGFRMDTPDGGNYWGAAGRDPAWDRYFASGKQGPPPQGFLRYSGGGIYAGLLVVVLALWGVVQAFRGDAGVFGPDRRRCIWFWLGALVVALLLAFGRHAPFYQLLYQLPYFSTIRNPSKFTHLVSWSLVILFAFGMHGLVRRYWETGSAPAVALRAHLRAWWKKATAFDRRWLLGSAIALGASVLAWLIYAASRPALEAHLQETGFEGPLAAEIARFSLRHAGYFLFWLAATFGLLAVVLSGWFAGRRARAGAVLLGLLLVTDLARANLPWIIFVDYKLKLATNPVIEFLRQKPHEYRAAELPFRAPGDRGLLNQLYRIEWAQHHFQYFNIQSLDIVQMSREPEDKIAYEAALQPRPDALHRYLRRWQLTNTRYLLGPAGFVDALNRDLDPEQRRFRAALRFDLAPKPGFPNPRRLEEITAVPAPNGEYALIEFTGALPRAALYTRWEILTNNTATLERLADPAFDPAQTVLVSAPAQLPAPPPDTNAAPGRVEIVHYQPKYIRLRAQVQTPAVLLHNDRIAPHWHARVNGQPAPLLRCNYLMRGLALEQPGDYEIEFRYTPPTTALQISLAAIALGLLLLATLAGDHFRRARNPTPPPR